MGPWISWFRESLPRASYFADARAVSAVIGAVALPDAVGGEPVDHWTTRVAEPKHPSHLVVGLARKLLELSRFLFGLLDETLARVVVFRCHLQLPDQSKRLLVYFSMVAHHVLRERDAVAEAGAGRRDVEGGP